ncbi:MAG TPA: hypothetical protein VFK40_02940 [Nitrososphaeraceae archaeon]|nr:hypothetical protein [Nitrososphaeraceae archaeon]
MWERDTLSREISDLNTVSYDNRFDAVSRIKGEYIPTKYSKCYQRLDPQIRKQIAEETDKEFRRITNFHDKLPSSISLAKNDRERNLIRTWLRIRDIVVEDKGIEKICPCKPIPRITMKDMQEFESIGGRTLKNHGPTISDGTLKERLEKHIQFLQNLLGSSNVSSDDMEKFRDQFIEQSIGTGVEYEYGGLFVSTKWITKEFMIENINNTIRGDWDSICSYINSKKKWDPLHAGGKYYKSGKGFFYDHLSQSKQIIPFKGSGYNLTISPTDQNEYGWFIENAYPNRFP